MQTQAVFDEGHNIKITVIEMTEKEINTVKNNMSSNSDKVPQLFLWCSMGGVDRARSLGEHG